MACSPHPSRRLYVKPGGNQCDGDGTAANPFAKFQRALGMSEEGDTIVLKPGGIDLENIDFMLNNRSRLVVKGEFGSEQTFLIPATTGTPTMNLDARSFDQIGRCTVMGITFQSSQGAPALMLHTTESRPFTVIDCRFQDGNSTGASGISLYFLPGSYAGADSIVNNTFYGNSGGDGAAILIGESAKLLSGGQKGLDTVIIGGNLFQGNTATSVMSILPVWNLPIKVVSNRFTGNIGYSCISHGGNERAYWEGNIWDSNLVIAGQAVHRTNHSRTTNVFINNTFFGNAFSGPAGDCVIAKGRFLTFGEESLFEHDQRQWFSHC